MLMVWDPGTHRATLDIDLLARTNNSDENITRILKAICAQSIPLDDGLLFDVQDLSLEKSQVETEYAGLSARFSAHLHTAKLPMRIDIGFSDRIYPKIGKEIPKAFSEEFYQMPKTKARWNAFLKGIGHEEIPFDDVVVEIRNFFLPILTLDREAADEEVGVVAGPDEGARVHVLDAEG